MRYDQLLLLLRGKLPPDLLPPVRPGYVWARVQALAEGTCLPSYQWAGGGPTAGRPWTPDLPTDTALVLYLFAAFIDAPGWEFTVRQAGAQSSRGMPLFLGQLQNRPPNQYSAILTYRPDRPSPRVDAILALNLAGMTPLMCFLAEGRILALTGYQVTFLLPAGSYQVERCCPVLRFPAGSVPRGHHVPALPQTAVQFGAGQPLPARPGSQPGGSDRAAGSQPRRRAQTVRLRVVVSL